VFTCFLQYKAKISTANIVGGAHKLVRRMLSGLKSAWMIWQRCICSTISIRWITRIMTNHSCSFSPRLLHEFTKSCHMPNIISRLYRTTAATNTWLPWINTSSANSSCSLLSITWGKSHQKNFRRNVRQNYTCTSINWKSEPGIRSYIVYYHQWCLVNIVTCWLQCDYADSFVASHLVLNKFHYYY